MTKSGNNADVPTRIQRSMYVNMLKIRLFEEKVADLVAGGEIICPCHLYVGEEAVAAGVCANLRRDDMVFSTHRSHGHYIAKGGDIRTLMAELYGRKTGCAGGRGGSMHLASPEIGFPGSTAIVAGSIPPAAGVALAFSLQKKDSVSVSFFGDGAVNEGVWYETLNFASLKKLPVIFVCENNLYSTHMPVSSCLADSEIYKKASTLNMPGVRIDGNDVAEVYRTAKKAIDTARRGKGPTLIECMTYRWRGHVGPNFDLDKGLRSREELDSWMARCPIKALEKRLIADGKINESDRDRLYRDIEKEIEEALAFAKASPLPEGDELLDNVFKT